ncbi:MAG: hypothetical protein P1U42_06405 [Phycisphaerales bacterium]|nr:hypothetical protein [Phycisphaerales bacterium]
MFISGFFIFESDTNTLFKWESALTISTIAWLLIVPKQFSKLESNWTHGGYTRDATTVFFDTFIYSAIIIILVVLASWILLGMSVLGSIA